MPAANLISSGVFLSAIHKSGAAASWLLDHSPAICTLRFSSSYFLSVYISPPVLLLLFANISGVGFCFLKVARLAQTTGHDGRYLVLMGDHAENVPCMSLLCIDQTCPAWTNATVVLH